MEPTRQGPSLFNFRSQHIETILSCSFNTLEKKPHRSYTNLWKTALYDLVTLWQWALSLWRPGGERGWRHRHMQMRSTTPPFLTPTCMAQKNYVKPPQISKGKFIFKQSQVKVKHMFIQLWSNDITRIAIAIIIIEHYPTQMSVFHNNKKREKKYIKMHL